MATDTRYHSSFQSYSEITIRNAVLAEILAGYPDLGFELEEDSCAFWEESCACRYTAVPHSLEEIPDAICRGCGDEVDDQTIRQFQITCESREEEILDAYEFVDWHFSDCGWEGDRKEPMGAHSYDEDTMQSFREDFSLWNDMDSDEVEEDALREYAAECSSDYQTHFTYEDGKSSYGHTYERM